MTSPEILGCCLVLISFALFYHFVCWTDSSSPPQIFSWNVLFLCEETAPSPLVSAISCLPGFALGVPAGTSWCGTFSSLWAWLKEPCPCQASLGRRSSFSSSRIFPLLRLLPWNLEDGENHRQRKDLGVLDSGRLEFKPWLCHLHTRVSQKSYFSFLNLIKKWKS